MSHITVSNLTFAYEGSFDNIFENVSFCIDTDWKLGFVGRNGRGKTTFLNLLQNKFGYKGHITKSVDVIYFPFDVTDENEYVYEIAYSIVPNAQMWELERELSLLDVRDDVLYRPFYTLSAGERTKVLIAALFLKQHAFLLIDEPTNHLDQDGRTKLAQYLNRKNGFILVSHDRAFLDACTDHTISLNKTDISVQKGNFSSWQLNKKFQDNFERSEHEKLVKTISRLETAARQTSTWSDKVEKTKNGEYVAGLRPDRGAIGHKSAKMMKRSKAIQARREKAVEDTTKLLKNIENTDALKITQKPYHNSTLLSARDLSIQYCDSKICEGVTFSIDVGERVFLQGKNGCGKSSILKLLCGENISYTGHLDVGSGLEISYVPQDTSFLHGSLDEFILENKVDQTLIKTILRKMDFSRLQFEKQLDTYSQGQKKKVLIAASLCHQSHLYIWDEPLNYIDIFSRMQIQDLVKKSNPTMIVVEHDSAFVDDVSTKTIYL